MTAAVETPLRAGRWSIDVDRSTARFAVRNFGIGTVEGRVPISEAYAQVGTGGTVTCVHARLDLEGLDTRNPRRDADLRKPRLLDTATFPTVVFTAREARAVPGGGWQVPGTVTAHGHSATVVLTATRDGNHVHASCSLDRRDLGVKAPRVLIGREVRIEIDAVLVGWSS